MTCIEHESRTRPGGPPVAVLGATGQQGGAVVRALLERDRPVRALARDPGTGPARRLAHAGVEVVAADLGDPRSLRVASRAGAVFSVQPSSGQAGSGVTNDDEVRLGVAVVDAARDAGSATSCTARQRRGTRPTGVGHFDTKAPSRSTCAHPGHRAPSFARPLSWRSCCCRGRAWPTGGLTFLNRPTSPAVHRRGGRRPGRRRRPR